MNLFSSNTKFLTNQGFISIDQFNQDTKIYYVGPDFKILATKRYSIHSLRDLYNITVYTNFKDTCYETLNNSKFINGIPSALSFHEEDIYLMKGVDINNKYYSMSIGVFCLFWFIIDSYFTQVDTDTFISNKQDTKTITHLFTTIKDVTGISLDYDFITKKYTIRTKSLNKSISEMFNFLIYHQGQAKHIFEVIDILGLTTTGNTTKFIHAKHYQTACLLQLLCKLIGYKSYVKFNKGTNQFFVAYSDIKRNITLKPYISKKSSLMFNFYIDIPCKYLITSIDYLGVTSINYIRPLLLQDLSPLEFYEFFKNDEDSLEIIK